MAVKVKSKSEPVKTNTSNQYVNPLKIPAITAPSPKAPNIIIRAIKIMLMDIRMRINPRTKEELETYTEFSNLAYGRR